MISLGVVHGPALGFGHLRVELSFFLSAVPNYLSVVPIFLSTMSPPGKRRPPAWRRSLAWTVKREKKLHPNCTTLQRDPGAPPPPQFRRKKGISPFGFGKCVSPGGDIPQAPRGNPNVDFGNPVLDFEKPHLDFENPDLDFENPILDFENPVLNFVQTHQKQAAGTFLTIFWSTFWPNSGSRLGRIVVHI